MFSSFPLKFALTLLKDKSKLRLVFIFFIKSKYGVSAYATMKLTEPGLEGLERRLILITLSTKNVKNLEKIQEIKVKGPVEMPTKVLNIIPRKSSYGEARIDLFSSSNVVKQITSITIEPSVEVDVTIVDS
ncbi:hypothetical protein R3W88_021464 [Solanum pinnatisectum]|uniref:Uncharacterized protein n=1 Tax=Solanum pinnatisectum TaxID=50273 RepID=A0AAV9LRX6_9SOLN|nr:hypothetical protein R3W88_021464 [Solanum pinnatisectum]